MSTPTELFHLFFHRGIDFISLVCIKDALIFMQMMQLVIHWGMQFNHH